MNLMALSIEGSRARFLALVAIVACLLGVHCNAADTKIYLEIKGISGDVTDRGYENQIAVVSYGGVKISKFDGTPVQRALTQAIVRNGDIDSIAESDKGRFHDAPQMARTITGLAAG